MKEYYQKNREKIEEYQKQWRVKNKEYMREYRLKNKEYMREYRLENRKIVYEKHRQWILNNYEKYKEYRNNYHKNKNKTDSTFNLNYRISIAIGKSLKGNKAGRKWEDLLGYNLTDLKKRLQKTMPEGYTWQDYLEGRLHIDHIIPKSVFNFTKPEHADFKRCWELKNLRLLPAKENLRKFTKLEKPFQPALNI
jgi:5-methylcytosine-specific restriction endonuclease McrA